jgi:hypothetical protein
MSAFERALLGDEFGGGTSKGMGATAADLYDTDTSDEGAGKSFTRQKKQYLKAPVSLPFPPTRKPVGIGGQNIVVPITSSSKMDEKRQDSKIMRGGNASPFVDPEDKDALRYEKNNLFLVQLPTRLPPLTLGEIISDEVANVEAAADELAAVATPALQTSTFDNSLSNAIPGRLGKIKVHKSGKTVLVLESPDGQPAVS